MAAEPAADAKSDDERTENRVERFDSVLDQSIHLSGTLGLSIGVCGRAIVVWTRPVCGVAGAHCTLVWRPSGFGEVDVQHVKTLRREFLGNSHRVSFSTRGGPRITRDPSKIRYDVDEDCGLFKFVEFVRNRVSNDWIEYLGDPTVHVTSRRKRGDDSWSRMVSEPLVSANAA